MYINFANSILQAKLFSRFFTVLQMLTVCRVTSFMLFEICLTVFHFNVTFTSHVMFFSNIMNQRLFMNIY